VLLTKEADTCRTLTFIHQGGLIA